MAWARRNIVPATLPLLAVVCVFAVWAATEGGYPVTDWYPAALLCLGLLAVAVIVNPQRFREIPLAPRIAIVSLAAFTAWSFATIAWADAPGDAWDAANRTLLYLLVFVLFAAWTQREGGAALVLGLWTGALVGVALWTLVDLETTRDPLALFVDDRLREPVGYHNAAAALWHMALWPALILASRAAVPFVFRGLFAGGAVLLIGLALLSLSRGAVYSLPLVAIFMLAITPGRVRLLLTTAAVAAGAAVAVPGLLDVSDRITAGATGADVVGSAVTTLLVCAGAVALVVAAAGAWETRRPLPEPTARRAGRAVGWAAAGLAVAGAAVALALIGNPVTEVEEAWDSFKGGYSDSSEGSRLTSGLGSNRYDFYRVAWQSFENAPLEGVGGDNYLQDYLLHGESEETPRFPHSLELRTLSQTGIVGAALLLIAIVASLYAAFRASRRLGRLLPAVAAAAASVFAYWFIHGSLDWFFEYPGLAAPAFAMLGLCCALAPRGPRRRGFADDPNAVATAWATWGGSYDRPMPARLRVGLAVGLTLLAGASLALPWLAALETREAGEVWQEDLSEAYGRLGRAADLNPLSEEPLLTEGAIALQAGDLARAARAFDEAIDRERRSYLGTLELGAIRSAQGDGAEALRLVRRAAGLSPRDPLALDALAVVERGETLDVYALNRRILGRTRKLLD